MVKISTIKHLGKLAVDEFKNLSNKQKTGLALIFGTGLGFGISRIKRPATPENVVALQAEKEKLQAQCDSLQNELNEGEVAHPFEYTPEMNYTDSDTTFDKNGNPSEINYSDSLSHDSETVSFEKDGSVHSSSSLRHEDWTIYDKRYDRVHDYKNKNGELIVRIYNNLATSDYRIMEYLDGEICNEQIGNCDVDVSESRYYPPVYRAGKVVYRDKEDATITYYNKKLGRDVKIKQLEGGELKYTITPKYDRDGVLIKRDTTWNKPQKQ